jgi:hypothetical protein
MRPVAFAWKPLPRPRSGAAASRTTADYFEGEGVAALGGDRTFVSVMSTPV